MQQPFPKPEYQPLFPIYEDGKTYTEFKQSVKGHLMTSSPHVYQRIETGVEPEFLIPPLDQLVATAHRTYAVAASPATKKGSSAAAGTPGAGTPPAAAIQPPDLPDNIPKHWISIPGGALPSWSSLISFADADYKCKKYYYKNTRNPIFFGAQGTDIWRDLKSCVIKRQYAYDHFEKNKAWSNLYSSVPQSHQDKIALSKDFALALSTLDYAWLWEQIKFSITGEGNTTLPLLFTKMWKLHMVGDDFSTYARAYTHIVDDIRSRKYPGEQLVQILFDTMFYMGLHGSTNTILKPQLNLIYENAVWPPASESIPKFMKLLTTLEKVESAYAGDGVIKANLAKTNVKRNAANSTKPAASGRTSMCWNCARTGHLCTNCHAPISTCATCSGSHHTLAHDAVKTAEARAVSKGKSALPSRTQKVQANMSEAIASDDANDDEQYESMLAIAANQTFIEEENAADDQYDGEDEYTVDEPTGSIFGFNSVIRRINGKALDPDDDSYPSSVAGSDTDDDLPPPLADSSDSDDDESEPHVPIAHKRSAKPINYDLPPPLAETSSDSDDNSKPHIRITRKRNITTTATTTTNPVICTVCTAAHNVVRLDEKAWNLVTQIPTNAAAVNIHSEPADIIAYLDSAAGGHIFLPEDRFNLMFTHVSASKGIVIEGVDESAAPIPVLYTAKHSILGHCHFAQIRNRLISIPKLLKKEFSMLGKKGNIVIRNSDDEVVFDAIPDEKGLFPVNLTALHPPCQLETIKAFDGTLVHAAPKIDRPMSHLEIERAHRCRHQHCCNGHPSYSTMKEGYDNNVWPDNDLTSADLDNAEKLLGPCPGCAEGKLTNPNEPMVSEVRAHAPGEQLYFDIIKTYARCIGGHTQALVCRDYVTGYVTVIGMIDKSTQSIIQAILSIIAFYASYGHTCKVLVFDHEATFVALEHKIPGVRTQYTPAGMKNKTVERAIRELKDKDRCTRANLPYELPANLEIESWIAQAESMNALPNSRSGPNHTPFQLVTNLRPALRPIAFGTPVLAYARSYKDPQQRAEWGVYLSERFRGDSRVYLPQSDVIVSRRHVVAQTSYPNDWRFIRRPKLISATPVPSVLDIPDTTAAAQPVVNPLIAPNPLPMRHVNAPTAVVPAAPPAPTTQHLLPSISHLIPRAIPSATNQPATNESDQPQAAAPETNQLQAAAPAAIVTPAVSVSTPVSTEPRYTFRENRKPPARFQANVSLSARVNPLKFTYGKRNKGIPTPTNARNSHVDLDKVKARIIAYRISMRQALKDPDPQRAASAKTAMLEELTQLVDSGTFHTKPFQNLSQEQRRRVIPSHMFFKDKFFADGKFQKLKARLVAGGNFVDTSLVGDISSWTVNPITVMMMLNLAALAELSILTIDVKGAFLIPELTDSPSDLTYVTIDKALSDEIVKIKPAWLSMRNPSGTYTMQLRKTLYGLGISSNRWMTHLNTTLVKLGFTVSPRDRCCFVRGTKAESRVLICSHVDDILCVGHPAGLAEFKKEFAVEYEINTQEGFKHSYIGLDIIQEPSTHKVSIGQTGYRRDVLICFAHLLNNSRGDGRIPCGPDIVEADPPDCDKVDRSAYMSIIMSVMFLSRFTRPDLAFAVSMLSTHCTDPNEHHMSQAKRLLKYIANSPDMAIVFKVVQCVPTIYADASHATHHDDHGHGCTIIKLGNGMVYCRSYKLKIVTLSSTESEHVVLCDATTLAEWLLDNAKVHARPS